MPALFSQLFQLLSQALYLLLHVTGGGTFPRALSAAQERQCLEEMAQGSQAARQKLIEHNLRRTSSRNTTPARTTRRI